MIFGNINHLKLFFAGLTILDGLIPYFSIMVELTGNAALVGYIMTARSLL